MVEKKYDSFVFFLFLCVWSYLRKYIYVYFLFVKNCTQKWLLPYGNWCSTFFVKFLFGFFFTFFPLSLSKKKKYKFQSRKIELNSQAIQLGLGWWDLCIELRIQAKKKKKIHWNERETFFYIARKQEHGETMQRFLFVIFLRTLECLLLWLERSQWWWWWWCVCLCVFCISVLYFGSSLVLVLFSINDVITASILSPVWRS